MKKILFVLLLFAIPVFLVAQNRAIIDKVVGTVGNELLLLSDIEEQHELMQQQRGVLPENFRCAIMENQLAEKLLLNQAKLDSVIVGDEEVEAQLQARIDQILAYMNGDVSQFEDYYGQSIAKVKESFRDDLKNQLLVQRMRAQIVSNVTVTPSEVKAFFGGIHPDSLPYFNSEVEIGEIVYNPKVNEEEDEKARILLEEIKTRIVDGGEDFGELAKKYSNDPGSGRIGGDLGMQRRGTFVPEFEATAYNLEKGEISELTKTEFGFHLIQLMDRRGNNIHCRHILITPEITQADLDLAQEKLKRIQQQIMSDSLSFSNAVKSYSDKNEQSYNNDGGMVNPKTGKGIFETGDLEPDIYFTIDTMQVGDISAPIEFQTRTGDTAYRLVLLKSRTAPHKASLQTDYSKIKAAAVEQKTNLIVSDWVYDKISSTFIEIDPMFLGCPQLQNWIANGIQP